MLETHKKLNRLKVLELTAPEEKSLPLLMENLQRKQQSPQALDRRPVTKLVMLQKFRVALKRKLLHLLPKK